jgi:signal transduction histidine kinase
MARLIEDLLDAARGNIGGFRLDWTEVDLLAVIGQSLEVAQPLVEARGHTLHVRLPPAPLTLQGDATRLAQVFCNLLDNACKYTPRGGEITLEARVGDDAVTVAISDNGIGISAEALPRVFEMFGQEARAKDVDAAGLGIGLAVVRSLVEAHGGSIVAHSAGAGLGSEFVVTLPLRQPAPK